MKEFVEKLISRLQKATYDMEICEEQFDMNSPYFMDVDYKMVKFDDAKTIINELAEEYSENTPQKSAGGWIPVTERLPEYDEESEYYEAVIVTLDSGRVTNAYYRNLDDEWWVNAGGVSRYEKTEHVIAWQSFPKAYGLQKSADWKKNLMNGFLNVE